MREIIVGLGVHAHSTLALDWATRLAKRQGARVTVFNAFHCSMRQPSGTPI